MNGAAKTGGPKIGEGEIGGPKFGEGKFGEGMPTIAIVATGGTIAMKNDPATGAPVPALTGADLAAAVPGLSDRARIEVVDFANLPSAYLGPDLWPDLSRLVTGLLARPEIAGAIVLHGTDTLDQTAYFLDLTVPDGKPVVLVGAQRNASDADADGARNLLNAARQILAPGSGDLGVTVTLNHNVNAAREVRKSHTNNVETFNSGEAGFLGHVDEDRVVFARRSLRRQTLPLPGRLARVGLVAMVAGDDGAALRDAVARGAEGVVIAAYGFGNVNEALHDAVVEAIRAGVVIVVASQVPHGRALPVYGFKGGGHTLLAAGAVFADDLSPDKARVLALLALPITRDRKALQAYYDR